MAVQVIVNYLNGKALIVQKEINKMRGRTIIFSQTVNISNGLIFVEKCTCTCLITAKVCVLKHVLIYNALTSVV